MTWVTCPGCLSPVEYDPAGFKGVKLTVQDFAGKSYTYYVHRGCSAMAFAALDPDNLPPSHEE